MARVINPSEHMFVEWSRDIRPDNYDVTRVAELLRRMEQPRLVGLDVGGGIGRYAKLVCDKVPGCRMVVLDKSELAAESFVRDERLELCCQDYFEYNPDQRYDFVLFKTVLHHFVGDDERETTALQKRALDKALRLLRPGGLLLIEENFYQGALGGDLPGRLIYAVTRSRRLEELARRLGANSAGEGVRFRSLRSWNKLLAEQGFLVYSAVRSPTWGKPWSLWQRLLLGGAGRYQAVLEVKPERPEQYR